ncbi:MAG: hypothetical protein ACI9ZV_000961 [Candidatus Azotimanducaceae bacterium]|jgi:hypothetical protein
MSADSTEKSSFGVYFYATLMALLGALLGFVYMTTFTPQAFSSQAEYQASLADLEGREEPIPVRKPGDAYYIQGIVPRTRSWEPKRLQLSAAGAQTVRFSEGEINSWMTAKFRPGVAPSGEDAPSLLIVPGVPNVAIADEGTVYFNLPTTISAYGASNDFTISARCGLDASAGVQFDSVSISSAKVPLPGIFGAKLYRMLMKGFESTEEYKIISEAFARAESIEVVGSELVFKLR